MDDAEKQKFLSVRTLSAATNESSSVWRKRIRDGEVDSVKFGRNRRVPLASFKRYVSARMKAAR
jgi:hypothetical protein